MWPSAADRDTQFRLELARAGRTGLRALGAVEIASALLVLARWPLAVGLMALGLATLLIARSTGRVLPQRTAALLSALGAVTLLGAAAGDAALAGCMVVQLAFAVGIPVWPIHALAVGAAAALLGHQFDPGHDLFFLVLALLSSAIAAALHLRRSAEHRSRQESLRIAEALSGAQLRAQLAESAVAVGKLAAAVTHEINTPLGSLTSAVDTLLVLAAKQTSERPVERERFINLQNDLRRAVQAATERIRAVIARLQRFISLDEAELQAANINELISDVAILFREQQAERGIQLEFVFEEVPALMCRPQLLTAVISTLLSNAVNAANGNGRIVISTHRVGERVEIAVEDNGRGMSDEEIENIFDPGFKKSGTRMAAGNWSLFNSRQIVFEHGGEIRIESKVGKGTTVCVSLPLS